MIQKVEMYTMICDGCGKDVCQNTDYSCWNEQDMVREQASEEGWIEIDHDNFCPDCWGWDETESEQIPKKNILKGYLNHIPDVRKEVSNNNTFQLIRDWAKNKGILDNSDPKTQFLKLLEEVGELSESILKNKDDEFVDAIGDCVVVLTNLAALKGKNIEDCISTAYDVISKRKGEMVNGTFVKHS